MLSLPQSDPRRALRVQQIAKARFKRYSWSTQQNDLEESIFHFTEAICLQLPGDKHPPGLNIAQIFCFLTHAIFLRAKKSRQTEDVKYCIRHLRYLRAQWHEVPIDFPSSVTATLIGAMAIQVELGLGDVAQDIEEMSDLCDELLIPDPPTTFPAGPILAFAGIVFAHLLVKGSFYAKVPSENVIGCLRRAMTRLPEFHDLSIVLAQSLLCRFHKTHCEDDYQDGMAILDQIVNFRDPKDMPSPYAGSASAMAAEFAVTQYYMSGRPEHLEQAIYRYRTLLDGTSLDEADRPSADNMLSTLEGLRLPNSSFKVKALFSNSGSADLKVPPFRDLTASLTELGVVEPLSPATYNKHGVAFRAIDILGLSDITDIEDGVKYCRQLLSSYPRSHFAPEARSSLGVLQFRAFECTNKIEYLDQAISSARHHINTSDPLVSRVASLLGLIKFLTSRLDLFRRTEDLDELMQLFPMVAADYGYTRLLHQSQISCKWASIARRFGHPSVSTAYDRAMSSMEVALTCSPTLDTQHSQLLSMNQGVKTLSLDYSSYQIHSGQLEQAVETLEQGRTLVWSEVRGFRTSIDQIKSADTNLAHKFAALNRDLEALTLAFSSLNNVDGRDSNLEGMDSFSELVAQQRKLLDDRNELISKIQTLPGFDTFLKPPSFDTLRYAASDGPVVIINHCEWRSDILLLLHNSPPSLISTSDDFYARANKLQGQLLGARKEGLESDGYEDTLCFVLKGLYELVGRSVIKRLNQLGVPEQSRVWWCPTSVFCSLPLHAMGPIPSEVGPPRYFLDLYIPSYTPSLSALMESRKLGSQVAGKPSILLVAHPDEEMLQALKEMKVVQAVDTEVTILFSAKATPTRALERLQDHQFAHIVCHGILEPGKPFEASFKLYKGKRLQLLDIVRSRLPDAEFAFLSACHTAEQTEETIADEVLHLAAAMQFCGFRSVVGTMWAMADTDGRDLARDFYDSIFSGKTQAVPYYERAAQGLRDAVRNLRRKGGMSLERWVNFVHYGA
jgi:CHAT domain-containing protein